MSPALGSGMASQYCKIATNYKVYGSTEFFKIYIIIVFMCLLQVLVVAGRIFNLHCSMWELWLGQENP